MNAAAQPAQPTPPDGGTPATLDGGASTASSDEDLADLQRAIAADAAASPGTRQTSSGGRSPADTPPPAPNPASGIAGALQSLNPDISLIADVAGAWFTSEEPLQSGGHDPTQRGFNLQNLELAVASAVDPYFRFNANIVFGGEHGVEVEEVYASTLALPLGLQARVGQFLTQFGRLNNTHPHAWYFVDQPFALGRVFGPENNRGLGAELSWISPLPWYLEMLGSVTDPAAEGATRSFFGDTGRTTQLPLDFQFTGAVKQFFDLTDTWSFLLGVSGANGPNALGESTRSAIYGVDLYFKYRPVSSADPTQLGLQTEWFYRRRRQPGDVLSDLNGYLYGFWKFDTRWIAGARYEYGTPSWNEAGEAVEDPLDPEWTSARHRISANLTFLPTEFSRIRLQGAADLPGWRPEPDYSVFLAFEFAVGAHGAHAF